MVSSAVANALEVSVCLQNPLQMEQFKQRDCLWPRHLLVHIVGEKAVDVNHWWQEMH